MSYSSMIMESISNYPELEIIDAQKIYKERFNNVPEQAFYQAVSRMVKREKIQRVGKGIYCKPKKGKYGTIISGEKSILEYYLGPKRNKGVIVGYRMYNLYGLTNQVSKTIEIYSNVPIEDKKQIRNVSVKRLKMKFEKSVVKMIELLEVLQSYKEIEDLNTNRLIGFIEETVQNYDEKVLQRLQNTIGYKKSTLASLKNVLDYFGIDNHVGLYLKGTSRYKSLSMEELNDITS